ncbi:hypothetical protein [Longimicrobium sp.]|uniref:hypothetical protein n=1 Tax=Longimicrobium sp. TaxID=2029185 RepID=UPI003B3A6965
MKRILALAAAALLAACNGLMTDPTSNAGVVYGADRQAYSLADEIVVTLANTSDAEVGYNLCGAALEQRTGGGWTRVSRNPEMPCIQPLYILRPGERASVREAASRFPGPGTYRLRTGIESPMQGPWKQVVTQPFTVQE